MNIPVPPMCNFLECGAAPDPLDAEQMREYLRGYALVMVPACCVSFIALIALFI